jgi:hypothetical protein
MRTAIDTLTLRVTGRLPTPRALMALGLATVLLLAAAGGAWSFSQYRYGRLLYEYRFRSQVKGRSAALVSPGRAGIGLALLQWHRPDRATLEGGHRSCRSCSGCSAYPSA